MHIDPFRRQMQIYEAKAKLASTIHSMTKTKKYVKFSDLKKKLDVDDSAFDAIIQNAKKANRYSNKYIFTTVEDEPAIGITAVKRKNSNNATPTEQLDATDSRFQAGEGGEGKDFVSAYPEPVQGWLSAVKFPPSVRESREYKHRENELWRIMHRDGWRGLDRLDILPENWQGMTDNQIVENILTGEFHLDEAMSKLQLKDWVADYIIARNSGNTKDAQILYRTISDQIKRQGLNPKDIWFMFGDPDNPKTRNETMRKVQKFKKVKSLF